MHVIIALFGIMEVQIIEDPGFCNLVVQIYKNGKYSILMLACFLAIVKEIIMHNTGCFPFLP